jgi:hypothetical protein
MNKGKDKMIENEDEDSNNVNEDGEDDDDDEYMPNVHMHCALYIIPSGMIPISN